jgi:hypothetical protein
MKTSNIPLLVTTQHRGVFFGYGKPTENKIIRLEQARMCVYWSAELKGVLGLATMGPTKSCKIGPAVLVLTLQDVTSVTEVTKEASEQWEKGHWNG